jgi:hypothetical protein
MEMLSQLAKDDTFLLYCDHIGMRSCVAETFTYSAVPRALTP